MDFQDFLHPLSSLETIETDEGEKEVMNSWFFASLTWYETVKGGNHQAYSISKILFPDQQKLHSLLALSRLRVKTEAERRQAAIKEAIAILATALEEKIEQKFSS